MSILLKSQIIIVTQEFIDHADSMYEIRDKEGERVFKSRSKCDALLYEWWMIKNRHVSPATCKSHDFIWNGMKIDCKEVNGKYFNIQKNKKQWYNDSINKDELSHFLFYESTRVDGAIMKDGDVIHITPLYVLPAKIVIKSSNESTQSDTHEGFISKSTLEMLAGE